MPFPSCKQPIHFLVILTLQKHIRLIIQWYILTIRCLKRNNTLILVQLVISGCGGNLCISWKWLRFFGFLECLAPTLPWYECYACHLFERFTTGSLWVESRPVIRRLEFRNEGPECPCSWTTEKHNPPQKPWYLFGPIWGRPRNKLEETKRRVKSKMFLTRETKPT